MTIPTEFLESSFTRILHISAQASVLVILILLVQTLLRKRITPFWHHALWGLVAIRLLLLWTVPAPFSLYNVETYANNFVAVEKMQPTTAAQPAAPTTTTTFRVGETSATATATATSTAPLLHAPSKTSYSTTAIAALLWFVGLCATLLIIVLQASRLARRITEHRLVTDPAALELFEACKQKLHVATWIALVETPALRGPALMGVIRPRLLLPAGYIAATEPEQLRHVLLHELAHFKRGDILVGWSCNLLLAIHWFNPLLWWAWRRACVDRELACDAHVLATLPPQDRNAYGHTLLDQFQLFAPPIWSPALAGVLEGKTKMERRITMVRHFKESSRRSTVLAIATLLILGCVALTDATRAEAQKTDAQKRIQEKAPPEQQTQGPDVSIRQPDIWAWTAPNGGTMIVGRITNATPIKLVAEIAFYEGDPDKGGTLIGKGGLELPANGTGSETIMWPTEPGVHIITAIVDPDNTIDESNEENNRATRRIIVRGNGRFEYENTLVDNIDRPFVNDPAVLGRWESVDFVGTIDQFDPLKKRWRGDLYLKELVFLENGKTPKSWLTWTKAYVMHTGSKTASKYTIKEMDDTAYLFYEWKSGDVTIRHDPPKYYVLRKSAASPASLANMEIGDSREKIVAALGTPEKGSTKNWLIYKQAYAVDFLLGDDGKATEIRFNLGFQEDIGYGTRIGDPLDEVLRKHGGTLKTVRATDKEVKRIAHGDDRVLYEKDDGDGVYAYKFMDAKKGVLYWFNADKRLTQIVAFKPHGG